MVDKTYKDTEKKDSSRHKVRGIRGLKPRKGTKGDPWYHVRFAALQNKSQNKVPEGIFLAALLASGLIESLVRTYDGSYYSENEPPIVSGPAMTTKEGNTFRRLLPDALYSAVQIAAAQASDERSTFTRQHLEKFAAWLYANSNGTVKPRDARGRRQKLTWPEVVEQIKARKPPVRCGIVADLLGADRGTVQRLYQSQGFRTWDAAVEAARRAAK